MKAIEVTGQIDDQGHLSLDQPVVIAAQSRVRVIILYAEDFSKTEPNPDDTPLEEVRAGLRRAFAEAKAGQRIPIAQMWEGIDSDP